MTLFAGNDGGVYRQHLAPGDSLSNDNWGRGANNGMNTLQPYDAAMAKDGTLYMGLQDNGEGKIDPDGKAYTVFGGDGFFTAVDPDNADHAFEEYVGGDIAATKDGGKTWTDIQPANITGAAFATPFEMDANDANHLMIGGRDVEETTEGRRHQLGHVDEGLRPRHPEAPGRRERRGRRRRSRQPALGGRREVGQGAGQRADRAEDQGLRQHRRREHAARRPGARHRRAGRPLAARSRRAPTRTRRSRSARTTVTPRC